MAAFDPAILERWRALAIVDRDGTTVGTISEFYLDRETGHPTWALVNTGLFGTTQAFVPLVHATEISDGLQVPYERRHIRDSPRVDLHDELTPAEEAALFAHYGVGYEPVAEAPTGIDEAAGSGEDVAADERAAAGEPLGPVAPASTVQPTVVEGEGGPPQAGATEALPIEHEPAEADGGQHVPGPVTVTAAVPDEPGPTEPAEAGPVDRDAVGSEVELVEAPGGERVETPGVARPDGHPDPGTDPDQLPPTATDPEQFQATPADPDLGRAAPVEPGLPGSTVASPYGAAAMVDKGAGPSAYPADEPLRAPGEAGWLPAAAGSFEAQPVDPPPGTSDRWREAKLAAERDRIARATAAQPEERSPLERARRRLERLVGGGQEPADHEITPAEREAAERARRARLGLDEEDQRRR